jgi:hypothetical protein
MVICKECGVALESDMRICPLCQTPVSHERSEPLTLQHSKDRPKADDKKKYLLSQILWQITAVLLLSGIVATLVINLAIQGQITWSVYPISICLMILSYASLMSLWRARITYQLAAGWILSALVLTVVNGVIVADWPMMLALPILCAVNIVTFALIFISRSLTTKGLNVFAIVIAGIAVLCLFIEGIISSYFEHEIRVQWSAIVSACLLPVTATILFMYFRTRNNNDLQKIFHT